MDGWGPLGNNAWWIKLDGVAQDFSQEELFVLQRKRFEGRGSQARLKAQSRPIGDAVASGACRAGVRGFESHPLHHGHTHRTTENFQRFVVVA